MSVWITFSTGEEEKKPKPHKKCWCYKNTPKNKCQKNNIFAFFYVGIQFYRVFFCICCYVIIAIYFEIHDVIYYCVSDMWKKYDYWKTANSYQISVYRTQKNHVSLYVYEYIVWYMLLNWKKSSYFMPLSCLLIYIHFTKKFREHINPHTVYTMVQDKYLLFCQTIS